MRIGAYFALGVVAGVAKLPKAEAEPRPEKPPIEASGFVGVSLLSNTVQLGDSWAAEQVPGNGALFGLRLGLLALPEFVTLDASRRFQLGIEAEAEMSASNTRSAQLATSRRSYFAPVFQWRGNLMVRYVDDALPLWPNLVLGGGGATVASESPYMRKESDPVVYYGAGVTLPLAASWFARVDGRHTLFASRGGGITSGVEIQFGIGSSFGVPTRRFAARPAEPLPQQPVVDETDSDHDGLPDHIDRCPDEKETVNGRDDGDGCPEPDGDADGVVGDADKCPAVAEDTDGFQDEDGCPDPDNDGDGIDDKLDKCPAAAETRNGFDDEDGCPDGVPAAVTTLLATASTAIKFEGARARVTEASKMALVPVLALLEQRRTMRLSIRARPATVKATELAKRRAEAVKWYLVEQGVAEDRFVTGVGAPGKAALIDLTPILP